MSVTVRNSTFTSGFYQVIGCLYIYQAPSLTFISQSSFTNCSTWSTSTSHFGGGAIEVVGSREVRIFDSDFRYNSARIAGGAIWSYENQFVWISGCLFESNGLDSTTTQPQGFAIWNSRTELLLEDTSVQNSWYTGPPCQVEYGAAVWSVHNIPTVIFQMADSDITDNRVDCSIAGLYVDIGQPTEFEMLYIEDSEFVGNIGNDFGAALLRGFENRAVGYVQQVSFLGNEITNASAVFPCSSALAMLFPGVLVMSGTEVSANVARGNCATMSLWRNPRNDIYSGLNPRLVVLSSTIKDNIGVTSGGLFIASATVEFNLDVLFSNNSATQPQMGGDLTQITEPDPQGFLNTRVQIYTSTISPSSSPDRPSIAVVGPASPNIRTRFTVVGVNASSTFTVSPNSLRLEYASLDVRTSATFQNFTARSYAFIQLQPFRYSFDNLTLTGPCSIVGNQTTTPVNITTQVVVVAPGGSRQSVTFSNLILRSTADFVAQTRFALMRASWRFFAHALLF